MMGKRENESSFAIQLTTIFLLGALVTVSGVHEALAGIAENEAKAIADTLTVLSAEASYAAANCGYFSDLPNLCQDGPCFGVAIPGYPAARPGFLHPDLGQVSPYEKSGYFRTWQGLSYPDRLPSWCDQASFVEFCYRSEPSTPGSTGLRSFAGTGGGVLYVDPSGAAIPCPVPQGTATLSLPTMESPVPGSQLSGSTVVAQWTAKDVPVSEWRLHVGNALGRKNHYDSGSLGTELSTAVRGLPMDGSILYFRLHYRIGDTWFFFDFKYGAAGEPSGYYVLDGHGGVHRGGSAPLLNPPTPYFDFDIARDLELGVTGYYVLDGLGGVHAGGGAPETTLATDYFGFDVAKDIELAPVPRGVRGTPAVFYVLDGLGGVQAGGAAVPMGFNTPYFSSDIARDIELSSTGYYLLDGFGSVYAVAGAPPMSPPAPYFGFDIAKDLELAISGFYVLDGFGGVHPGGGAVLSGSGTPYFGFDIARDLELRSSGYYVLDGYGGVHAGGSAPTLSPNTPYFGFDIARDLELR